ncbi:MAG: glycine C-acetyltransferase [bacterium]|nr:glycine C-acetyltransferase [bacterium]
MYNGFKDFLSGELTGIRESGLFKSERIIDSPQGAEIRVRNRDVLNFCANNYLGLGDHPKLIEAARPRSMSAAMDCRRCASLRHQDIHKKLENKLGEVRWHGRRDSLPSCFDANGGLFETLLKEEDVIITDALNHASIIDGIRLSKAKRYIYKNCDMQDLEERLKESQDARFRLIGTDGSSPMDGSIAPLPQICDLAEKYDAMVMVDDSHATGFMGPHGRGTHEHHGVMGRIDVLTSTLGKALGGASGGFTAARQEIVDLLRQRSRPYLFSNTVPPPIIAVASAAIDMLTETTALRDKLHNNTRYFRKAMTEAGFDIKPGEHPIVPIMLYDAHKAQDMAAAMLEEGVYVIGFFFPVVPKGQARIRVQISAAHDGDHLDTAIAAFKKVGKSLGVTK